MSQLEKTLSPSLLCLLAISIVWLGGCTTAYYGVMEQFGTEKRHILKDRVEAGQKAQEEARQQFETTYEAFKTVARYDGGDLEGYYDKMESDFEECEERAENVRKRIGAIEAVSEDLFVEWEAEIDQISNANLRRRSQTTFRESQMRYDRMIDAMQRASRKMDPVLTAFHDQVLFLKHNLNARALASLKSNVIEIESDVNALVKDMQSAITEAQRFLDTMPEGQS